MSSLTFCLADWLGRPGVRAEIVDFMRQNELSFYGLLSNYRDKAEHKRDLVLFASESTLKKFIDTNVPNLCLIDANYQDDISNALFQVSNVSLSRKYWQPVLHKFLNDSHIFA